jgi:hypothetical protein
MGRTLRRFCEAMQPLLYLFARTFVNRIKRYLSSPKRLISLIAIAAYWFLVVARPMSGSYRRPRSLPSGFAFDLPPLEVIQAFSFAAFAFLTLILALSTSVQRLSFRPADVDVLFPTPISPRLVLLFRFGRDYLISLLIPLVAVVFGWRPTMQGFEMLFRNVPNPSSAGYVLRAASLAWILVALTWVSISYALSLFINRSDLISDRNRRYITFGGGALVLGVGGYIAWHISQHQGLEGFVTLTQDGILRFVFFTASAASAMIMAPLTGNWLPFLTSIIGLLAITGGAMMIATSQSDWMYDQAAARGFDSLRLRSLQQKGDLIGMAAERARSRTSKTKSFNWAMRIKTRGPMAILWREAIIQLRTSPLMLFLFAGLGIMFGVIPMLGRGESNEAGYMFLGMQGMLVFVGSMSISQSGFMELLRRVDLEKPLPFSPALISFSEVAAKALPSVLSLLIAAAVCVVIQPTLWPFCLASLVGLPFIAVLCCSIIFLVTLIFPDLDDPTLRGFRGLMILLGLAIVLVPVAALSIGVGFLTHSLIIAPVIGAAVGAGMALGLSVIICLIAGNLYAGFNPSE